MGGQMPDNASSGHSPQRVLVTGGTSGIGRAMVQAFLDTDATVHVADLAGTPPEGASMTRTDVSDEGSVDELFDAVEEHLGGLDVLCNNVGIAGPTGPIEALDVDDWDQTMAVNVRSMFLVCRRAVSLLRRAGGGSILNTSSTAGITGYPMRSPYATSKWAVVGLGATLAMELGELGIRVNTICPGSVGGDRMDRVIAAEATAAGTGEAEIRTGYENQVSMRTFVDAEDIAAMAVFLASPAARLVNGQTISVDGGLETLRNTWRT
ncbi:MAG: SDR family oxidoreductase [Acidimicrobiales bacterium]|nr:SDR family oxidoreductase [Acidimicrobiales bacterium]MDP7209040.1 SDR family oxidoreductase [Acidimicrobiales bacterium]HJO98306.1 SDR family oxidoreductase [Acidimicrobiales bacterium]